MKINSHSHNKPSNININSSVLLGYTQEHNKEKLERYLYEGLVLLID